MELMRSKVGNGGRSRTTTRACVCVACPPASLTLLSARVVRDERQRGRGSRPDHLQASVWAVVSGAGGSHRQTQPSQSHNSGRRSSAAASELLTGV